MKICPNCHKEFNDDINFCKSCGTPLVDGLTCPKCGAPIDKEDTFCGACGYQLQEPQEEKQEEVEIAKPEEKQPFSAAKIIGPLGVFVSALILIFAIVSFIGCFGDVVQKVDTINGISSSQGLNYFSDMFSDATEMNKYHYDASASTISTLAIIQLLFLILAFMAVIFGVIFTIVNLATYSKNKDQFHLNFKNKILYIYPLLALPYPVSFLLAYGAKMNTNISSKYAETTLSWGTMMIFVTSIISLCLLIIFDAAKRLAYEKEKYGVLNSGSIVLELLKTGLYIAFVLVLLIAADKSIFIKYTLSGVTLRGHGGSFSDYAALLIQSEQNGTKLPSYAGAMYAGYLLLGFSYFISIPFIILMDNKRVGVTTVFGAILMLLLLLGFIFTYSGMGANMEDNGGGIVSSDAVLFSGLGVVLFVLLPAIPFFNLLKKTHLNSLKTAE